MLVCGGRLREAPEEEEHGVTAAGRETAEMTSLCSAASAGMDRAAHHAPGLLQTLPLVFAALASLPSRPSTADTEWLLGKPRFTSLFEGEISWLKRFLRTLVTSKSIFKKRGKEQIS